ncbi:1-deoxy-D-xylulose-5-phosphate reductoisomerase [Pseudonocardia nigra]|uniref:1-deoxy-D-xylulose-5-phosphate reductoisomerase n=1 Tax=Pseudonocardia nigra TaxID=1921578 RepID=UPI001C5FD925|nr:1-deoxy-D-xylulose-5-phosphate reductoisomerase [Pseudonocardia nigra]
MTRSVLVLGSTGSIGTQALDVLAAHPDRFAVAGLAAGGGDLDLLARQVRAHDVRRVAVSRPDAAPALRERLPGVEVLAGPDAATELTATAGADMVLNGITGSVGLGPTLAALASGATLALANKESLVAGGALVTGAAAPGQIVPVDSEHSALAQCLRGGRAEEVERLVLTASGGPFRGRRRADLAAVTVEEALAHPTWAMGPVITINSATLINKGLEVIEAHLLFGVPYDRIDVAVHPQSIVHSMVTFTDGSTLAQASPPDMKLPIALALGWPDRLAGATTPCRWDATQSWTFEPLDDDAFPGVRLARAAGTAGGCVPAVLNAANEEAVAAFVAGALPFVGITDLLERVLDAADAWTADPATVADVLAAEEWARARARELAGRAGVTT